MRREGWESALNKFIERNREKRFSFIEGYGINCAAFVAGAIRAMTGLNLLNDFKYSSKADANEILNTYGDLEGLAEAIAETYGFTSVNVSLARRGDACLIKTPHGSTLGVVIGSQAATPGIDGLEFVPVSDCSRTWRIN